MARMPPRQAPKIMPLEKRLMLDASLPVTAGQVLWLDAADKTTIADADGDNAASGTGGSNNGFSGSVAAWRDKSGANNHVASSMASEQPSYTNTLNGRSVITFDGVDDRLFNTAASVAGDDFTVFAVFNRTTNTGRDALFELGGSGSRNGVYMGERASKISYFINNVWHEFSANYTGGSYELISVMHDTNSITAFRAGSGELSTTGATRTSTTGIYIGDDSTTGDQLQGHIAEFIVYDRDLTADERHDVETYLAGKWGLSVTNTGPTLDRNTGSSLAFGTSRTITSSMLSSSDVDNSESMLQYKITELTDHGTLSNINTGRVYTLGEYFTQRDINLGYVQYTHNGSGNSDSFSFTVSDQVATTSAATFNLSITSTNQAPQIQGWTLVSSEDFQSGATGWSDNTTETGGTYLTRFLGRHSQEAGAQNTHKTYTLSGAQDYTVITFDMYKLDSWDGEFFRLFVNDAQAINLSLSQSAFNQPSDGSAGTVSYTVQELTPFAANFVYGAWNDQIFRFTLTVSNSAAANMKLGFSSTLDQPINDESWGVDNIKIYEVSSGGVPGPIGIVENSAAGTVVGRITAKDANVGQVISYSIVGGTGASLFAINASSGRITVTGSLDYEAAASYTLDIRATDNGAPSMYDQETVTIRVLDLPENSAPGINAISPLTVAENAANGTVIGTATGSDPDGNTITWSITGGNNENIFSINAATGAITVGNNANLNYDYRSVYTLTVQAQDNGFGLLTATQSVTINITNVNEAPTFDIPQSFLNQNPNLRYNAATGNFYQYIGTTATPAAASAAASAAMLNGVAGHLATITSAAENAYVRGLGTGNLWLGADDAITEGTWSWAGSGSEGGRTFWIGYSNGAAQNGFYTNWISGQPNNSSNDDFLEMQAAGAWNDAPSTVSNAYVIEWEGAAVLASLGNGPFTVAENPILNQVVGTVHARDADAGDSIAYSITGGSGASYFGINAATGQIIVTDPASVDYEAATSFTLTVRAQDIAGLFSTRTVTVNVTNVNEAPMVSPAGPFNVMENTANGALIGTVGASDPDAGSSLTYSITGGNPYGIFAIDNSGRITVADSSRFNYETGDAYTLTIGVSDGALSTSQGITINVGDINESPSFDAIQALLASDSSLRYNAATGNFYKYMPYEADFHSAESAASAQALNGVVGYIAQSNSAMENAYLRALVASDIWLGGSDAAVEGRWVYTGGAEAGEVFWIGLAGGSAQNGHYTNWIPGQPNNAYSQHNLEMQLNGQWSDIYHTNLRHFVIEWDGASVLAGTENGPYSIDENSAAGAAIGVARAYDYDAGDALSYSVTGGTGAGLFAVDASTGQITLTGAVNYEAIASYTLALRVQDAGGLFDTLTIIVNVNDVNDAPDGLSLAGAHIVENSAIGTLVGTLATTDQDAGDTHIYSLVTNPGGKFTIIGNEIRSAQAIDYEQSQSFAISIRTDDGHGGIYIQNFRIDVGDVMDTSALPPAADPGASSGYLPPERDERFAPSANILEASLRNPAGTFDNFYGQQILRENVTLRLQTTDGGEYDLRLQSEEEAEGAVLNNAYLGTHPFFYIHDDGSTAPDFTNLREALHFLQEISDTQAESEEGGDGETDDRTKDLPMSALDRRFVDVMRYHEDRAARLRSALLSDHV